MSLAADFLERKCSGIGGRRYQNVLMYSRQRCFTKWTLKTCPISISAILRPLSSPWDPVQMACRVIGAPVSNANSWRHRVHKVIFACVHNAGRSQMAAAFFNQLADRDRRRPSQAGTEPGLRVHPEVQAAMQEVGMDLLTRSPRS